MPPVNATDVTPFLSPAASRGDLVMMLMTPVSALAPQMADAGPRTTSICLMSSMLDGT